MSTFPPLEIFLRTPMDKGLWSQPLQMETKFIKIKQLRAAFVNSEAERNTRARKAGKIWESWENKVKIRDNL